MTQKQRLVFELNGTPVDVWAFPYQTLLDVLREEAGSSEVKYGCGEGVCGTCTVLLDDESVNSCLLLAPQAAGRRVTTVRGLGTDGELHPLQVAFLEYGGSQCGFCTPGMLLAAVEFVRAADTPSRDDIREAISGNLCRCTGYSKILDAIESYVASRAEGEGRDG